jgi:hypothetical protein
MKYFSTLVVLSIALAYYIAGCGEAAAFRDIPLDGSYAHGHGLNAAKCFHRKFSFCGGCTINVPMRVRQNKTCPFNLKSLGPIAGQEILIHPRNGVFGAADQTAMAYRPKPGYLGDDYFKVRVYFEQVSGKRTFMTLNVNVRVVPTQGFR